MKSRVTLIVVRCTVSAALAAATSAVQSGFPEGVTKGELALAADFCQDVQTFNGWEQHVRHSPRTDYWLSKMGRTFWGMHHYCWAQINTRRANAPGMAPQHRTHLLNTAIDDYVYVLRVATPDFVMLPEIHYLIGETRVMLQQYGQALDAFQVSRTIKPDYWPPYVGEAGVQEKFGRKAEARAAILRGLRVMPQERVLLDHFKRLGGKPEELPKPAIQPAADPASAPAGSPAAQSQ